MNEQYQSVGSITPRLNVKTYRETRFSGKMGQDGYFPLHLHQKPFLDILLHPRKATGSKSQQTADKSWTSFFNLGAPSFATRSKDTTY